MISYIHSATIIVSDQDAAVDFYVNKLGWEKRMEAPMGPEMRFITIAPKGAKMELALGQPNWFDDGSRTPGGWTGISLVCTDIDDTYNTLTGRGVKFKSAPEAMPWGQKATWVYDLDGNEFF